MIALTLALALAQTPTQGCITVGGQRVCGYSCVDNGSRGACAKTELGVCAKNGSNITCFDPPTWLFAVWSSPPKPSCVTDATTIACGYDCKRQSGQALCAQTPKGVCVNTSNQLKCFDPPPEVYGALGSNVPAPSCVVREGRVACGYGCITGNGVPMCAQTPFGVCAEDGSVPQCFDPSKQLICAAGGSLAKPKCQPIGQGRLVCGYNCTTSSGVTACSQTPEGKCDTGGPGGPNCFDPPQRGGSSACLEAAAQSTR
jgi:hypothetical protein